jgi:nucleotidyltransferase substrate binding protein (TIGR01987 family)
MIIDTLYFDRCILTIQNAYSKLNQQDKESIEYDMYRSACIKEFEIILELSGNLLRKAIKPYFASSKEVDKLYFKDLFRHAVLHSVISDELCEHWLEYRDNRNNTAHDYGLHFAENTLILLPLFIEDAKKLSEILKLRNHDLKE